MARLILRPTTIFTPAGSKISNPIFIDTGYVIVHLTPQLFTKGFALYKEYQDKS
jgi:hypothetical protein